MRNRGLSALPRRRFLQAAGAFGAAAVGLTTATQARAQGTSGPRGTDFAPRAKRAIWLFMGGGPSQIDLFDHKPGLASLFDQDLPPSVIDQQRLTSMTSRQARFPIAPRRFPFQQNEQNGAWVSDLLPWTRRIAHELTIIKTVSTESINHEPAMLAINTGSQLGAKPSVGAGCRTRSVRPPMTCRRMR